MTAEKAYTSIRFENNWLIKSLENIEIPTVLNDQIVVPALGLKSLDELHVIVHGAGYKGRVIIVDGDMWGLVEKSKIPVKHVAGINVTDGFHTFAELYEFRLLYNAGLFNLMHKAGATYGVHKSKRHSEGDLCFGGDWFIVMAYIPQPDGTMIQISNHYHISEWDTFKIPERDMADRWDGHTPKDVARRIRAWLAV